MIRQWPVQQAIYAVMASDSMLFNSVTSISDQPPQNAVAPYVVLGEGTGTPDDVLDVSGSQQTMTIHVWDRDAPMSRVKQIMDRIVVILHNAKLTNAVTQFASCTVEYTGLDRDVETWHGVVRVRVLTFG